MRYKIIYFIYILLGICLLPFYIYRINPDAISYFNIAQNYILNTNPINGFWSPLLSWLLVPFFLLHVTPVLAFSIIQLIFGLSTLIILKNILFKFSINENIHYFATLCSIPLILYFVYEPLISPDLLALFFLLMYFNSVLSKKTNAIQVGVYGALAYFSKTYAFFFFILHFTLFMLYKNDKRNLIIGLITFLLITLPWIILISNHYHYLTIGNAGTYNFETSRPGSINDPHFYNGLFNPAVNTTSVWYDPSYLKISYTISNSSVTEVISWLKIIFKNIATMMLNYESFSVFSFVAIIYSLINIRKGQYLVLFLTFALFSLGYSIYHIEDRYIWFSVIILLLVISSLKVRKEFLLIMLLSFTIIPTKRLISNINYRKDIYLMSNEINVNGNIASNLEWNRSLYIAYFNNSKYYGIPQGNDDEVINDLNRNDINYILVWNNGPKYSFLPSLNITQQTKDLTVYKLASD